MEREELLRGELQIMQPDEKDGLRVNLDTILLADFTKPKKREQILELGCAHGAVSLILAKRGFTVEGVDIQQHLIELAVQNAALNGLSELASFRAADLRDYKKLWSPQAFDRVVVNPPYDEPESVNLSPSESVAVAMQGAECRLEDIAAAAKFLLKNRGRLDTVIRANRLCEFCSLLERYNVIPKVIRPVYPRPGATSSIVLIEAVRAAGNGVKIESPLFVLDKDGRETPELLAAYTTEE